MSTWGSRKHDEPGAAAIETALCICFIVLPIMFGIISYGFMLSFRQSLSQAATEGARAAAVAVSSGTRTTSAQSAVKQAIAGLANGHSCGDSALTCTVNIATCSYDATVQCATVTLTYLYKANPIAPSFPGLGILLPTNMTYSAVAEVS
jgi:Flp pilus assembly protein TadG